MSIHRPKRVTFRSNSRDTDKGEAQKAVKLPEWAEAVEGKGPKDFKAYAVSSTYLQGDLLKHPKFGEGVVLAVEPTKIEVLFESGPRKLAHAMA